MKVRKGRGRLGPRRPDLAARPSHPGHQGLRLQRLHGSGGRAGVVEPHTESPKLAHQELYFVAAGRARFTIDGQDYDAPAGTYVFVPDPASHRHAVAEEPGTTVLSFGGPPTFQPSACEWAFQAAPLMRTAPGEARRILNDRLENYPESGSLHYNLGLPRGDPGRRGDRTGTAAPDDRARA